MQTVMIDRSKITDEWLLTVVRDVTSGKPYPVIGSYPADGVTPDGILALQDTIRFVDDAGDDVYVWPDEVGVEVVGDAE